MIRSLGINGTRLAVIKDGAEAGYLEIDTNLAGAERHSRHSELADIGNLQVLAAGDEPLVMSALLRAARDWLELAEITRLLGYGESAEEIEPLCSLGFRFLTRTARGWTLS